MEVTLADLKTLPPTSQGVPSTRPHRNIHSARSTGDSSVVDVLRTQARLPHTLSSNPADIQQHIYSSSRLEGSEPVLEVRTARPSTEESQTIATTAKTPRKGGTLNRPRPPTHPTSSRNTKRPVTVEAQEGATESGRKEFIRRSTMSREATRKNITQRSFVVAATTFDDGDVENTAQESQLEGSGSASPGRAIYAGKKTIESLFEDPLRSPISVKPTQNFRSADVSSSPLLTSSSGGRSPKLKLKGTRSNELVQPTPESLPRVSTASAYVKRRLDSVVDALNEVQVERRAPLITEEDMNERRQIISGAPKRDVTPPSQRNRRVKGMQTLSDRLLHEAGLHENLRGRLQVLKDRAVSKESDTVSSARHKFYGDHRRRILRSLHPGLVEQLREEHKKRRQSFRGTTATSFFDDDEEAEENLGFFNDFGQPLRGDDLFDAVYESRFPDDTQQRADDERAVTKELAQIPFFITTGPGAVLRQDEYKTAHLRAQGEQWSSVPLEVKPVMKHKTSGDIAETRQRKRQLDELRVQEVTENFERRQAEALQSGANKKTLQKQWLIWILLMQRAKQFADCIAMRWAPFDEERRKRALFHPALGEARIAELTRASNLISRNMFPFRLRKRIERKVAAVTTLSRFLVACVRDIRVRWAVHQFLRHVKTVQRAFRRFRALRADRINLWTYQWTTVEPKMYRIIELREDIEVKEAVVAQQVRDVAAQKNVQLSAAITSLLKRCGGSGRLKLRELRELEKDKNLLKWIPKFEELEDRTPVPKDIVRQMMTDLFHELELEYLIAIKDHRKEVQRIKQQAEWLGHKGTQGLEFPPFPVMILFQRIDDLLNLILEHHHNEEKVQAEERQLEQKQNAQVRSQSIAKAQQMSLASFGATHGSFASSDATFLTRMTSDQEVDFAAMSDAEALRAGVMANTESLTSVLSILKHGDKKDIKQAEENLKKGKLLARRPSMRRRSVRSSSVSSASRHSAPSSPQSPQ